jgi:hypothetical protein
MKRWALLSVFAAAIALVAVAGTAQPVCDVDNDGDVDRADLVLIRNANGQSVPPADPALDPNGDGFVNVADVRYCQIRQTP